MLYLRSSYLLLPQSPGVYQFLDENNVILYVGKAKQLRNRVSSYFSNPNSLTGKTKLLVEKVKKIKIIVVQSELESLLLEASLIKKYQPKYNIKLIDGKNYPLIRITIKSISPAVLIARKMDDKNSIYFGPYPDSGALKNVLRSLRKIFPFQSVINHPKRICLYNHLGLCPCLSGEYKKNLNHIIQLLNGKTKTVIKNLENERKKESSLENFEKAQIIQNQITAMQIITKPFRKPFEYETNPSLKNDIREQEMKSLMEILEKDNIRISFPKRIECFDISNIQGANPTASMVVLTNGEIDKSQYRKFKIKTKGPNDFAMMQEVLTRRLKHKEWTYPDLFIVDGGKGQVSSAMEVLLSCHEDIPLIGLAKREETIITSNFQEISLLRSHPALQLIIRIRNEAHRFAITYHRKLRSKNFISWKEYSYLGKIEKLQADHLVSIFGNQNIF